VSAAAPLPADRDRLFVRRIIDERARSLFGDTLQEVIDLPTDERWQRFLEVADACDEEDAASGSQFRKMREVFIDVLSDVEAWVTVENARRATLTQKSRRRPSP